MTNYSWTPSNGTYSGTTDSSIRAWGTSLNLKLALETVGLVQTSDTGQINWSTVNGVGVGSFLGHEIYRFNDSLQSTSPIYVKISYHHFTMGYISTYVDVGSSTNGASELRGYGGPSSEAFSGGTDSISRLCFASGDNSGFVLSLWPDSSNGNASTILIIDRFRNGDGTPNGDGFMVIFKTKSSGNCWIRLIDCLNAPKTYRYSKSAANSLMPCNLSALSSTTISGTEYFSPHYAMIPNGNGLYHIKMVLTYSTYNYGFNNNVSISHLGEDRTYKTLGPNQSMFDSKKQQYATAAFWWSD